MNLLLPPIDRLGGSGIMRTHRNCVLFEKYEYFSEEPMDVGVWMRAEILADKLRARYEANSEQAWNLSRWPSGFSEEGENRLFVAVKGAWQGYFRLSREALYNPEDSSVPYTLLFDTRTWTPIPPVPVKCFRGFTYDVPRLSSPVTTVVLKSM